MVTRDVVTITIGAPAETVDRLFADPTLTSKWMKDISYEPGTTGSTYRLVSTAGGRSFAVTVVARNHLLLETKGVTVEVNARITALSPRKTLLVSEETFRFEGFLGRIFGALSKRSIHRAHGDQMARFKSFAERST